MKKILILLLLALCIPLLPTDAVSQENSTESATFEDGKVVVMPAHNLFRPIIADPLWPKFYAAYHYYTNELIQHGMIETSIGGSIPLVRIYANDNVTVEIGAQADATSAFIGADTSFDLINADYMVGLPVTVQWDELSFMFRFYHRSGHLGDDVIINDNISEKQIVSLEMLEGIVAYEPYDWLRVYGGGGIIPRPVPSSFGRWAYRLGVEAYLPTGSRAFPKIVGAVDVEGTEGGGYTPMFSAMLGTEMLTDKMYLMLEFYNGQAYHGQYFESKITYLGVGFYIFMP